MVIPPLNTPLQQRSKMARQVSCPSTSIQTSNQPNIPPEKQLQTHDIAIPILTPQQSSQEARLLRLLLFSASDFTTSTENVAMQRIERLKVQGDDGKSIGIVFLLREKSDGGCVSGSMVFANLQLR